MSSFSVGTCHSRVNGISASSPASLRSASQYEAPGISVITIISRMTSGYDIRRRRCRGFGRPAAGAVTTGRPNTASSPAGGALPATVTVPRRNRRPQARTTTVPAGVPVTGNSAARLASTTAGR